jgi:uncharacterized membrane protein
MNPGTILKLLHILAGFALVGGELGRTFAFRRAKQATEVKVVGEMLQLFTFFTSKFVSVGGLLTFVLGMITAWVQGGPVLILGFLLGGEINWVLASLILYIVIMLIVGFVSIPRGKAIGQALGAAMGQGKITPELTAALNDSVFNKGFIIQDVLILVIIILMVLKPF